MRRENKLGYLVVGFMLCLFMTNLILPAAAALVQKTIQVRGGVGIFIDDQKLNPTDVNGNPVDVFIYNGTTYLPVRAVGEAFGKTVQWDSKTQSVYVGKHDSTEPAVLLQDLDYFKGSDFEKLTTDKDNMGNTQTNCAYPGNSSTYYYRSSCNNTYLINGEYSCLKGTLYQRYDYRTGSSWNAYESTLEIYGDGKLLYTAEMGPGLKPIDFSVDLTGVLELRVNYDAGGANYESCSCLSNCGLYT